MTPSERNELAMKHIERFLNTKPGEIIPVSREEIKAHEDWMFSRRMGWDRARDEPRPSITQVLCKPS